MPALLWVQGLQGAANATASGEMAPDHIQVDRVVGGDEAGLEGNAPPFEFGAGEDAGGEGAGGGEDQLPVRQVLQGGEGGFLGHDPDALDALRRAGVSAQVLRVEQRGLGDAYLNALERALSIPVTALAR